MTKYSIIDFDHGVGGLSSGLERYNMFEVVGAPWLNEKNSFCYNLTHRSFFDIDTSTKIGRLDADISVFNPFLGDNYSRKGGANFKYHELNTILEWIRDFGTDYVIITTKPEAIPFFCDVSMSYTANNWPVYDMICLYLNQWYKVYQFVLDGANYGVPQHKFVNFYLCVKNDVSDGELYIMDKLYNMSTGYVTIKEAIGDLESSEYGDYDNNYIDFCKTGVSKLTWHNIDKKKQYLCSQVEEGSTASKTKTMAQKTGYVRPYYDKISPQVREDFYKLSSKGPSVHPIKNRPFSIREGARLFGLPDSFSWNKSLSKKEVASMIYNSISPIFGMVLAETLMNFIK